MLEMVKNKVVIDNIGDAEELVGLLLRNGYDAEVEIIRFDSPEDDTYVVSYAFDSYGVRRMTSENRGTRYEKYMDLRNEVAKENKEHAEKTDCDNDSKFDAEDFVNCLLGIKSNKRRLCE